MPRTYYVGFEEVAVSAAQDLVQILGASGKMLQILGFNVGMTDTTPPVNQQLAIRCRFMPATVTGGSGGTSVTPAPYDHGDAAASFTASVNNTTKATTSGTAQIVWEDGRKCVFWRRVHVSGTPIGRTKRGLCLRIVERS